MNAFENQKEQPIKVQTKLKFVKSEKTGAIVSFVSQNPKTGRICGVRWDSQYPKKICILDKKLVSEVLLNVLYDVTMIPMTEKEWVRGDSNDSSRVQGHDFHHLRQEGDI